MTNLLEDRTISMILTIPHVKELTRSNNNLDKNTSQPPSIPIYHGSIINIEHHEDTSDLIVRVPNFHHVSFPTVSVTINDDQLSETDSLKEARMKRRAPICPIRKSDENQTEMKITNAKRLAIGLRNLRRTIKTTCKTKRTTTTTTTNLNDITVIPVLPDVEIVTENFEKTTDIKKTSTKFHTPKLFLIKAKNFKIKKKQRQPSSNSLDNQTNTDDNTIENSLSIKENEHETTDTTIAQLIPNIPISITINPESTSAHHYSGGSLDQKTADIIESNENMNIIHSNDDDDRYSECYEITYEIDPDYHQEIQDASIKFDLNPYEYQDSSSTWLPVFPSNNYEQIDQTINQPSILENNELVYLNDSSIVNEDYTVIIELLKRALQIDTTSNDEDENALE